MAVGRCRPWSTLLSDIEINQVSDPFSFGKRISPQEPFQQTAGTCRRRSGSGCGGVSAMGPRHASGGLGRTPNPGLAVCAVQRTRASGDRAYRGEGALLAKHCFASARTHSRQRLGRTAERGSRRPPQSDPPRLPTGNPLFVLLPASGRHYRRCRAASPAERPPYFKRSSRLPPAHTTASQATPCHPHCASARLPSAPPAAMPMNMPVNSSALRRLRAGGTRP